MEFDWKRYGIVSVSVITVAPIVSSFVGGFHTLLASPLIAGITIAGIVGAGAGVALGEYINELF